MWKKTYSSSFNPETEPPTVELVRLKIHDELGVPIEMITVNGWMPPQGDSSEPYIEVQVEGDVSDSSIIDNIVYKHTGS